MSFEQIILTQYQNIVERSFKRTKDLVIPKEGWIRTVRKALNMSGVQLAKRLSVTKSSVSNAEKAELMGGITIKKMEQIAEAMNSRFIYFIIPENPIKDLLLDRAEIKAKQIVDNASFQMALESETLSKSQLKYEVERLQQDMLNKLPSDFWDDK